MKNSIRVELESHILDKINEGIIDNTNRDEWHFYCFNEDYYMIGYYNCSQWLKNHNIGELEGANICIYYEEDNFGESKKYDNTESIVNMLAYIYGEEILSYINADTIEELKEKLS